MSLHLDWCSYEAAKYAVEKWHYSRSLPTPPLLRIGVWENDVFVGAVLFGRGANKNLGKFVGLSCVEVCELTRIALTFHRSTVSRIASLAMRMMKRENDGVRLVISYADPEHDHIGAIYQAMNWVYAGMTPSSCLYKDASGRLWHQRQVSKSGIKPQYGELRHVPKIDDCQKIPQRGKHRYLYPLDKAMQRQIAPLAQPYPKRETRGRGEIDNAAQTNEQTGGASPTRPLCEMTDKIQEMATNAI